MENNFFEEAEVDKTLLEDISKYSWFLQCTLFLLKLFMNTSVQR